MRLPPNTIEGKWVAASSMGRPAQRWAGGTRLGDGRKCQLRLTTYSRKSEIRLLSFQDYEVIVSFAFSDNRELTAVNEDFSGSASRVVVTAHSKAVGACRKN